MCRPCDVCVGGGAGAALVVALAAEVFVGAGFAIAAPACTTTGAVVATMATIATAPIAPAAIRAPLPFFGTPAGSLQFGDVALGTLAAPAIGSVDAGVARFADVLRAHQPGDM